MGHQSSRSGDYLDPSAGRQDQDSRSPIDFTPQGTHLRLVSEAPSAHRSTGSSTVGEPGDDEDAEGESDEDGGQPVAGSRSRTAKKIFGRGPWSSISLEDSVVMHMAEGDNWDVICQNAEKPGKKGQKLQHGKVRKGAAWKEVCSEAPLLVENPLDSV
jgi:hypothetical protein